MAHVHRNGMEVVFEAKTGGTLVRPYGQEGFDWYEPGSVSYLHHTISADPVLRWLL